MNTQLSEKKANIHVTIIGIFYLVSGMWEHLVGLTQAEHISPGPGEYILLDVYRTYAMVLGLGTIIVGILLLCRRNVARLMALSIAWWNLFTSPMIDIWWNIYRMRWIEKYSGPILSSRVWTYSVILISIYTFLRIYIIRLLRIQGEFRNSEKKAQFREKEREKGEKGGTPII